MPTVIAHHDVKDTQHWLASPKREEFFGRLGVTNIRTFTDPQNPTRVAVLMDVADLDTTLAALQTAAASRCPKSGREYRSTTCNYRYAARLAR